MPRLGRAPKVLEPWVVSLDCSAIGSEHRANDEFKEVAARYRTEAKRVSDQIEGCSLMVAMFARTCIELTGRIAMPADKQPARDVLQMKDHT